MLGNETLSRAPAGLETEADAYAYLEGLRWGSDGPTMCPHCGSEKGAWYLKPKNPEGRKSKGGSAARSQRRVWKCRENSCRRQFSVLTNTVLHATKMPVRAWVGTIIDLCEDPAGVSAREIAARWEVTEKSAWAMLNRIQEALNQPEAAGAQLHTNAPLWFEVAPAEAAVFAQDLRDREADFADEMARKKQAEREAAERIELDVQRALALANEAQDMVAAPPKSAPEPSSSPVLNVAVASVGDADPEQASPPLKTAGTRGADTKDGPETAPVVTAPGAVSEPPKPRDPDAEDQVKSDVERALAEVFGDALPRQDVSSTGPETPTKSPAGEAPEEENSVAESTETPPSASPNLGAVSDERDGPKPSATEHKPAKSVRRKESKSSRKKRKKRARDAARKQAKSRSDRDSQPVDNAPKSEDRQASAPASTAPDGFSRAQARRQRRSVDEPVRDRGVGVSDSLGVGWLDGPPTNQPERAHHVSSEQGQLDGITASELGPSWASAEPDVSPESPKRNTPSENQLDFFSDAPVGDA